MCLVGESGSGKSVTGFSLMGLIDPPGRVSDELRDGRDLLRATERERDALRGRDIAMVFQEPMTAPRAHGGRADRRGLPDPRAHRPPPAWDRAVELMERVGIRGTGAARRAYPHVVRRHAPAVMIAIACALTPRLIIADEPTTALDVTVQAQVLELLFTLQAQAARRCCSSRTTWAWWPRSPTAWW